MLRFLYNLRVPTSHVGVRESHCYFKNDTSRKYVVKTLSRVVVPHVQSRTLLLLHGLNYLGVSDPRLLRLGRALALSGYKVLLPEVPELKSLVLNETTLRSLETLYKLVFSSEQLPLDVVLVSVSGGLGLLPLCHNNVERLRNVTTVGAYSDLSKTLSYAVRSYSVDNYGTYVFLYNYVDTVEKDCGRLKNYFYNAALHNTTNTQNTNYLKVLHKLSKKETQLCNKLEKNNPYLLSFAQEVLRVNSKLCTKLSPLNSISNLRCSGNFTLLHGKRDHVVHNSESHELYEKAKHNNSATLHVSSALSHGDTSNSLYSLLELPSLYSAVSKFSVP